MADYLLKMQGIVKKFPGVRALDRVDFDLGQGEVHCLVGENGAGKSTLIKVLSGVYPVDEGKIYINGKEVMIINPHRGRELGISVIYQELNLIHSLSVVENIFLGNEIVTRGVLNWREMKRKAKELFNSLGIDVPMNVLAKDLGIGQQQFVATAKALSLKAQILIMDEPSAVISGKELDRLFGLIGKLKKRGIGIIYISHRLDEIFEIGDRVTILRDGEKVKESRIKEITRNEMVEHMIGRKMKSYYVKEKVSVGKKTLIVKNLERKGIFSNINFDLRRGEILGISGLLGAGRTELAKAIVGADCIDKGEIFIDGEKVNIKSPSDAVNIGIGLIPEDRKSDGLLLSRSVKENVTLCVLKRICWLSVINFRKLFETTRRFVESLNIITPSLDCLVYNLSGGNQQKVVLAKWLALRCKILIMDEPTRGIDVGAKKEIYYLMNNFVKEGGSIILISSELPEILALSDRILVMCKGKITREFLHQEATQKKILEFSLPKVKR